MYSLFPPLQSDPSPEDGSIDHVETFLSAEAAEDAHLRDALFAASKADEPHPKGERQRADTDVF